MSELSRITYNAQRSSLELRVFTSPVLIIAGNPNRTFSPTTSTLIFGARDAVLVDALLIREDVDALGDMIASTGRTLTTIFITHGHRDHFLGSDRLIARFPGARVPTQEAPTPLMDTTFLRTAATQRVTAGAADFGSAENRCSSFDGIFIETRAQISVNTGLKPFLLPLYIAPVRRTQCDRDCAFCAGGFRAVGS